MASFEKKLEQFLEAALGKEVIDKPTADGLAAFSRSGEFEHKGWFSLSGALSSLAGLTLCIGFILIISRNWEMISDVTKISTFIAMLGGTHFLGLFVASKGYGKLATGLHFLGAGLFIAGVGLVAQIFHLHSEKGVSFLLWSGMILPLAILLRNGPIVLLSAVAFFIGSMKYLAYVNGSYYSFFNLFTLCFACVLAISALCIGLWLSKKENPIGDYLFVPASIMLMVVLYALGFNKHFYVRDLPVEVIYYLSSVSAVGLLAYLALLFTAKTKADKWLMVCIAMGALTVFSGFFLREVLGAFELGYKDFYYEYFSFGRMRRIYYFVLAGSVLAWVSYFSFAFYAVARGAFTHRKWLLNTGVVLVGIGLFTRFFELVSDMRDAGVMFIICGIVLFAMSFALEKWRRRLIAKNITGGQE